MAYHQLGILTHREGIADGQILLGMHVLRMKPDSSATYCTGNFWPSQEIITSDTNVNFFISSIFARHIALCALKQVVLSAP